MLGALNASAVERGHPAPDFALPLLPNSVVSSAHASPLLKLSEYRGKVVYLDFWQSSCAPCRETLPLLSGLRDEFARHDIEIVAVNTDTDPRAAMRMVETHGVNYPVVSDPSGHTARLYGLNGLPTAYLIARDGTVRGIHEGDLADDIHAVSRSLFALSGERNTEQQGEGN